MAVDTGVSTAVARTEARQRGLTTHDAAARLAQYGPNILPVAPGLPVWRLLLAQMVHFFAVLLWFASALAFIAGMPELGVAIAAIVVLNGVFAFVQEHRAERAAERLRELLPRRMTVIRDAEPRIVDAADLVPGDLVILSAGDRISADLHLERADALSLDLSALTGESVANRMEPGETLFAGTFVVEGEGEAQVMATGARTRLAGIARASTARRTTRTPLAQELNRVVRAIAAIAVCVGLGFFIVGVLLGLPPGAGFLFAIGVAVALVPEGLLPTVTLSLAVGAQRMAARHALVRRLESVETLGATTFICTDKTGTLTMNEMSVVEVWTPRGALCCSAAGYDPSAPIEVPDALAADLRELARSAARCSRGHATQRDGRWVAEGDPMEAAIDVLARRLGIDIGADELNAPVQRRFPFDARRRRTSVVANGWLLLKGASDAVLPLCRDPGDAPHAVEDLAARGLRVLAVATRRVSGVPVELDSAEIESDLALLGLIGLEDPPRPGVAEALNASRFIRQRAQ